MPETPWSNLFRRMGIATAIAAVVVVAGRLLDVIFAPQPTVLVALVLGAMSWVAAHYEALAPRPEWVQPHQPAHSARFTADLATRRVANMFVRARPGAGFEAGATAQLLDQLVQQRLTGDDEGERLSPELDAYLSAARDGHPTPLNRRALHAHLKEIDQL